jgi:nitric oxide synthase oxygenase domain/subunit/hemoglobin-like flavoprotein
MSAENVGITNSSNGASPPDPAMVESSRDAGVTWASLPPDKVEASPDDVVDETPHLVRQLSQLSLELEPEEKEMAILQASSQAKEALERYSLPLSKSDKVLVMQGWNKVLAFRTAFSEALLCHWRLLVTLAADDSGAVDTVAASIRLCERNQDPLATALGDRLWEAEDLIMGLLDGALRSLCPATQVVARESYRPIADDIALQKQRSAEGLLTLECETVEDYLLLLAQCGVQPKHWVEFIDAVAWALKTHAPYAQAADEEDLDKGHESAYLKATVQLVCLPAIDAYVDLRSLAFQYLYSVQVPQFWRRYNETARLGVGEVFYKTLLTKYPSLMDYFARTDMDSLAAHLMMTLDLLVKSVTELGHAEGTFRLALNDLARVHCRLGISTFNYMIVGVTILEVLDPLFQREEELTKDSEDPVTAKEMFNAFLRLYKEVMSIVYYPMLKQEKLMAEVKEFYRQIQEEFKWSDARLDGRIMEIEEEISLTGTYTQTSEELEMGARLAWRNSAKCIGRISWNTLQVRDCRHVSNPANIFREVEMHLKIATAGSSIQSVMTVFAPKKHWEMFGTRFWSSQYVRYAGYAMEDGTVIGDPANAEITQYLIDRNMWEPPERRTAFDVLPLVLKIPGKEKPFIYKLPSRCIFEVDLEHPSNPAISALGYRWTTIPAISNFKMTLGGVTYQNIPFNGWFMSTEIVRNLMERYNAGPAVAEALGIDIATNNAWRYAVAYEVSVFLFLFLLVRVCIYSNQSHPESLSLPRFHINDFSLSGLSCILSERISTPSSTPIPWASHSARMFVARGRNLAVNVQASGRGLVV